MSGHGLVIYADKKLRHGQDKQKSGDHGVETEVGEDLKQNGVMK